MNEQIEEQIRELLRKAMAPVDMELKRDLWPRMLRRLEERPRQVLWLDWALVGVRAMWFFFFPEGIVVLLYHL